MADHSLLLCCLRMVFKFVRVVKEKEEEKEGKGEEGKRKREKRERRGRNYMCPRKPTLWAYHMVLVVKNPPASAGDIRDADSIPGLGLQPTPVFLPGKSHGQRNLADCSPWGCKEMDMTEVT